MQSDFVVDLDYAVPLTKGDGPIVVVDDDQSQMIIIQTCYQMSKRENKLICLLSGDEFLEHIDNVRTNNAIMPEIVLLDINMPKKNGFDVLEEVRNLKGFEYLPTIVMFTSSDAESDKEKAKKLNANGFFSKPSSATDYINFFQFI